MRKETIEMLQNVIKTADSNNPPQTKIYVSDGGKSIAATDSKRLIRIKREENTNLLTDGFYDIAKIGKDLSLVKIELDARFPDVARVIPAGCTDNHTIKVQILDRKGKIITRDYKHLTAESIAIFAAMQKQTDYSKISFINPDFLNGILKPLCKLVDEIKISYTGANYPILFTAGTPDGFLEYVVMPMSIV